MRGCQGSPRHKAVRACLDSVFCPIIRADPALAFVSVRTRIILLALIPVAGFAASATAYLSGERNVGIAMQSVQQSIAISEASREFKRAITDDADRVKDYSAAAKS